MDLLTNVLLFSQFKLLILAIILVVAILVVKYNVPYKWCIVGVLVLGALLNVRSISSLPVNTNIEKKDYQNKYKEVKTIEGVHLEDKTFKSNSEDLSATPLTDKAINLVK